MTNIIGQKFGLWVVIGAAPQKVFPSGQKHGQVLCKCSCEKSTERVVLLRDLKNGKSTSCGCIGSRQTSERNTRHGLSKNRLYRIWKGMRARCLNPNHPTFCFYGGKKPNPVTICAEWIKSPEVFIKDMEQTFAPGLTIDRIDSEKEYSAENCRWITIQEQQRNKRSNRIVTLNETEKMCLAEAAEKIGVCRHSLKQKLNRSSGYLLINGFKIKDYVP